VKSYLRIVSCFIALTAFHKSHAQSTPNPIITIVPFLNISPDARSGALGDTGVAISPDANTAYWNPSKMVFLEQDANFSVSASPWYREIIKNSFLGYGSFVQKINHNNAIGVSMRYLKYGQIDLYDENHASLGTFAPNEYAIDASFARKFGDYFSLGLTARYIYSNVTNGSIIQGAQSVPVSTVAADVSLFATTDPTYTDKAIFAFGLDISNIGPKVSYAKTGQAYFLPANLKMGIVYTYIDEINNATASFGLDVNKLLVPTPPIRDSKGTIIQGQDDNRSVVSGIFGSFSDAPGGLNEELQEISCSPFLEICYDKTFALRGGLFYEDPNKGNRMYYTAGVGLLTSIADINLSYLINGNQDQNPLANTIRLSVLFHFGGKGSSWGH